ncbi:MAG: hypothetical protein H7263_00765, partial [Candidatus Sericytochromatia bacterium]|nr:hypothetical protein [Candidatus Sericytochromatia bacterium]
YKKGEVEISDVTNAYAKDSEMYEKSISEFRKFVEKEDVKKFFDSKKVSEGDSDKALKLLGFDNSDVKDDKKQLNINNNIQVNLDVQNLEKK